WRMRDLSKSRQTRIWNGDDADVRINRAKGIILGWRFVCARNSVKERRLADVRQSDDTSAQHRRGRYCDSPIAAITGGTTSISLRKFVDATKHMSRAPT